MKSVRLSLSVLSALVLSGVVPSLAQAATYYPQTSVHAAGITRAEFVRLAMESTGQNFLDGTHCFKDVTTQAFARQVCAAKQTGIVTGNPNGYFYPNARITLVEAAAIVVRVNHGSVRGDTLWYRPYLELLAEWDAFPAGVFNILDPISYSQATEMISAAMNPDDDDDNDDDDEDSDDDEDDELRLTVTASDTTVEPGDRVTFRIKLENRDNNDVENIDVVAELDDDMEFISATNGADDSDDEVEWDGIDVDEDETETLLLNVEIDDNADDGDTLRLRVRSEGLTVTRTIRVEDDDDDDDDDLRVTITDSEDPVEEGDLVTYRIKIENRDDNDDVRVDVLAELDDSMDFVSASDDGDEHNGDIEWDNIRIDEDEELTLTVTVRLNSSADDGDTLRFRVRANDVTDTETTRVDDDDNDDDNDDDSDVLISITDSDDIVEVGDLVTYRIEIENNENDDIELDVRAFLDDGMTFYSATVDGEEDGSDEVLWEDIEIDEDRTRVLLLVVRINNEVDDGDTIRLRVEAGDDQDTETTRIED